MKKRLGHLAIALIAGGLLSQPAPSERPGPIAGGGFLLTSGWRITPAGRQIPLDTFPMASALSPDGKYLVVLNSGQRPPSVIVLDATSASTVSTTPVEDGWLGLAFSPRGDRLYVGGGAHASVYEFSFAAGKLQSTRTFAIVPADKRTPRDFIGDLAFSPDGRLLYAADLYHDSLAVINPQSGIVIQRIKTGRRPYRILFHPDGKSFFVTHWADGTLGNYDTATGSMLTTVRVGAHPTDVVWRPGRPAEVTEGSPSWVARLFVAAANTNTVYAIAITAGNEMSPLEGINLAMTTRQPLGVTPSGLALSPDARRLFVACSGENAAAVVDVSEERGRVEGFIPVGSYPTALRALASGALVVLNGKGTGEQTGTASWIDPFTDRQLEDWSNRTLTNSPYEDALLDLPGELPRIEHVIYIVKGSAAEAAGEDITPNQHKLASEFVSLDNFYLDGDSVFDGLQWAMAGIASDYTERLAPTNRARRRVLDDFEGQEITATPPAGYLWSNVASAGLPLRNFGFFVENRPGAAAGSEQVAAVRDPVLGRYTNRFFRGPDPMFADIERAKVFLSELAEYEKSGSMPRLILIRLAGDLASAPAPLADNDAAFGTIVEAVSHSRFWPSTAIFALQADASGATRRAPAFVISPFAKHHAMDSAMYNTTSMLRTIELLLGLHPMTQFDAAARVMTGAFQRSPDPAPYIAVKPRVPAAR
jgi:YVTN family beta-propeller protein